MNKLRLNTKDESLREILGNGKKYVVPKFQRDYSWERTQLEILWEDITELKAGESYHYMGYLVLRETSPNEYKIVDGQQRITTFSLFVLACIQRLREIKNDNIADIMFRSFIGVEEFDGLHISRKLTLNKNNDYYYKKAVDGETLPQRGKKKTVHLMQNAINYYCEQIKSFEEGGDIGKMVEKVANQFLFTTIYIGDELSAYKVFETLNARGVQLSSADLLKNYLFSLVDVGNNIPDEVLTELEDEWETIGTNIGDKYYTDYILCEWNGRHKTVIKNKLFSSIKQHIIDGKAAKAYLSRLAKNSDLYEGLINPDSDFFKSHSNYKSIKSNIAFLKLFNIRQPLSLLMVAYEKFSIGDFEKLLDWIRIFSLRYHVICRQPSNELAPLYNQMSLSVHEESTIKELKNKLLRLYPKDDTFRLAFCDKEMPTQQSLKKAKYLLARLEEHLNPNNPIDEAILTIEHILPQKPNQAWTDSFGDNYNLFIQRIGNMALVTPKVNQKLAQKPFNQKKEILLQNKGYTVNQNIHDYDEWTSEQVASRQKRWADIAVELWKIG